MAPKTGTLRKDAMGKQRLLQIYTSRPARRSQPSRGLPGLPTVLAFAGILIVMVMLGKVQIAAWLAVAGGQLAAATAAAPTADGFHLYHHLGNLSPYFVPTNTPASLQSDAPANCTVTKAFLVHRHGSRQPLSDEVGVIRNLSYYIGNESALFANPKAPVPDGFAFLQDGWNSTFSTNHLSASGRRQLFDHGVAMRLQYPQLYADEVLAGDQDRVVESARWFMDGYYGRDANATAALRRIAEDNETISWITPMDTCDGWEYSFGGALVARWGAVYLPSIAKRINDALAPAYPAVKFTAAHVHGMLYACAYGTAVYGQDSSPWCPVFLPSEILAHEYEYDLLMRGAFGYGLPGDMGSVLGSLLVSNVTAFLQQNDGANLSLNFGHDTTIDLGLTALGLAADDVYPAEGPVDPDRAWRTARQVPFAANMVWRGLECGCERRIQLLLNGANFDLAPSGCQSDAFGTCSLSDFMNSKTVKAALAVKHGDARWQAACSA